MRNISLKLSRDEIASAANLTVTLPFLLVSQT